MSDFVYIHNLSPFLIHAHWLGQTIGLRWYGLAYVVGLASAFLSFNGAAKRGLLPGLTPEAQAQMLLVLVAGVIGGGRLGYVLQHPGRLLSDPLFFFRIWESGMAFFGGLVGVVLALAWTARRFGLSFWTLADVAAFPAAFGLGVGRIANFVNGELVGRPTGGDWGVIFPRVDALPRHPSQLYEAASHFLLLGVLLWLLRRRPQMARERPGVFAALFLALYGALRFLTDFYRADDTYFGPFSSGQWASLIVAVFGLCLLARSVANSQATPLISYTPQQDNHAQ
jgi:phosphatidylglycerol:prolipoprotein diacylglycerol transferase